jgi:hypothetical protein
MATNPNPKQSDLQVCRKRGREGLVRTGSGGARNEQSGKGTVPVAMMAATVDRIWKRDDTEQVATR